MSTRDQRQGSSSIEFALSCLFWVPLLLGTLVYGTSLVRIVQASHFCRDIGHMYATGLLFASSGERTLVDQLGGSLNFKSDGTGRGTIILSTVVAVGDGACTNASHGGIVYGTGTAGSYHHNDNCTNFGSTVFVHRIVLGSTGFTSHFGTPTGVSIDGNGSVNVDDRMTKSGDRVAIVHPLDTLALTDGASAYVVEVYFPSAFGTTMVGNPGLYDVYVF